MEVKDSRTRCSIPVHYGLGVWPAGKIVGASPSSASVGFTEGLSPPRHLTLLIWQHKSPRPNEPEVRKFQVLAQFEVHTDSRSRPKWAGSPQVPRFMLQYFQICRSYHCLSLNRMSKKFFLARFARSNSTFLLQC